MTVISAQVKYWAYDYVFGTGAGPSMLIDHAAKIVYYKDATALETDVLDLTGTEFATYTSVNTFFEDTLSFNNLHLNVSRIKDFYSDTTLPVILPGPQTTVELSGGGPLALNDVFLTSQGNGQEDVVYQTWMDLFGDVTYGASISTTLPAEYAVQEEVTKKLQTELAAYLTAYTDAGNAAAETAAADAFAAKLKTLVDGINLNSGIGSVELGFVVALDTGVALDDAGGAPQASILTNGNEVIVQGDTNFIRILKFYDGDQMLGTLVDETSGVAYALSEAIHEIRVMKSYQRLDETWASYADVESNSRSLSDANVNNGLNDILEINLDSYLEAFGHNPDYLRNIVIDSSRVSKFVSFADRGYALGKLPDISFTDAVDISFEVGSTAGAGDAGSYLELLGLPGGSDVHLFGQPGSLLYGVEINHDVNISSSDDVEVSYFDIYGDDGNNTIDATNYDVNVSGKIYINGGAGADHINGSDNVDIIEGGAGNDILAGGGGRDQFNFNFYDFEGAGLGDDRITDFALGDTLHFNFEFADGEYYNDFYLLGDGDVTVTVGATDYVVISDEKLGNGDTKITYGFGASQSTVTIEAPKLYVSETGERWGNYIKYGVYAKEDFAASNVMAHVAWDDDDYTMVPGSSKLYAGGEYGFKNEKYTDPSYAGYTQTSFTIASPTNSPQSFAKGDKLYDFMLERDSSAGAKPDTLLITNMEVGDGQNTNIPFYFSFAQDNVELNILSHSGEYAPNGKYFTASGSVMDGLVIVPKAAQSFPIENRSVIEYDIELRVSDPMINIPLSLPASYVVKVEGGIDFKTLYANMDANLPASIKSSDITFYKVDETKIKSGDTWSSIKSDSTVTTALTLNEIGSQGAWDIFDDEALASSDQSLYMEFNTAAMKLDGAFNVSDGSFTLASFLAGSSNGNAFNGTNFGLFYQDVGATDDLYTVFSGPSGIELTWDSMFEEDYDNRGVNDGSEVYITGDRIYENPIGMEAAITSRDASLALDVAASVGRKFDNTTYIAADFNQDGQVDNVDAQNILRYSAHIKSYEDGGTQYVPKPTWYYIDNIDNDNASRPNEKTAISYEIADRFDVKFDPKVDYFIGSDRYIDVTAVLVGDVSANYIAVPNNMNPVYFDQPADAGAGNANNGNTGEMATMVIGSWGPSSTENADAIMVEGVARHLTSSNPSVAVDVTTDVDPGHAAGTEGHDDTWAASISDGGMMTLTRTAVGTDDTLTVASLSGAREAALTVVESVNNSMDSNELVFVGYVDSGKTYVWEIRETDTEGVFSIETEYQITGTATALNTSANADGTIYLDGYTTVSSGATVALALDETYVVPSGAAETFTATTSILDTGAANAPLPPVIIGFETANDTINLSAFSSITSQPDSGLVVATQDESTTAASLTAALAEANPALTTSTSNPLVVLLNITDTDVVMPGNQAGQAVLVDTAGDLSFKLQIGFGPGTFADLSEVLAVLDAGIQP